MTSFAARLQPSRLPLPGAGHHTVQVFAGADPDHRALCGELTFRPDEAEAFLELVSKGEARRVAAERRARAVEIRESISEADVAVRARQLHVAACGEGCTVRGGRDDDWLDLARAQLADERVKAGA